MQSEICCRLVPTVNPHRLRTCPKPDSACISTNGALPPFRGALFRWQLVRPSPDETVVTHCAGKATVHTTEADEGFVMPAALSLAI